MKTSRIIARAIASVAVIVAAIAAAAVWHANQVRAFNQSVHAQSRTRVEANIPFDFAVGNARLKPGQYIVDFADTEKLFVTSVDGKTKVFALAPGILDPKRNDPSGRLVFHRYGNLYFLSEVWISGNGNGNGLYPSKAERRLAKELAKTNGKPETKEILARAK